MATVKSIKNFNAKSKMLLMINNIEETKQV